MHVWGVRAVEPRCLKADRWEPAWEKRAAPAWEKGQQACTPRDLSRRMREGCPRIVQLSSAHCSPKRKWEVNIWFFNFFSTCVSCQDWSHGTAHHALPIYLMFGSFLNVHMVYQFICLAATPRLCAQSGCCCQTYKMIYHDVRECKKGFAERGAQEVSRPEPWQKACAFHFVASHFSRAICVSNTQMRVGKKLQVYIYWDSILWSQVKLADTIYWQGSAANTPGHHIFIDFIL